MGRVPRKGCAGSPDPATMRSMNSTLHDPAVAAVLARLRAQADSQDAPAKGRGAARERELGRKLYGRERADAYGVTPLAISAEVGRLLYVLAVARRPRTI